MYNLEKRENLSILFPHLRSFRLLSYYRKAKHSASTRVPNSLSLKRPFLVGTSVAEDQRVSRFEIHGVARAQKGTLGGIA